ncbi:LPXTG cell wall anchor domain-containing protein [Enterococcus mundtii]|uniref:LPXTG cell wall anchor domain-containing protein n=1 Tax=Enterococcus TaxID=1350 RepID=UPI00044C8D2A|nr:MULTISPECIES: LPXTG cell wall anchor domain-containing protein [Enterococcus]AZP91969.1 hypothetical protein CYK55_01990 [Enterococcus mundtii]EYT94398.1 hypothetical protein AK89_13940 [Enterococcus mundtii CRL35]MDK4210916.1 LPXTG cell wall anchor domain-containing protein [Enterococcus mundtii]MDO7880522.1 LPXTG cell wall anchor domain-containing protein [Enterococcus mundtii]
MKRKNTRWLLIALLILSFLTKPTHAQEIQQVETNGSIGFTGVYEPIGSPDPLPPETIVKPPLSEVAKPGGLLPQTNEASSFWPVWLGMLLLSFVFLLWKRKNKQTQK